MCKHTHAVYTPTADTTTSTRQLTCTDCQYLQLPSAQPTPYLHPRHARHDDAGNTYSSRTRVRWLRGALQVRTNASARPLAVGRDEAGVHDRWWGVWCGVVCVWRGTGSHWRCLRECLMQSARSTRPPTPLSATMAGGLGRTEGGYKRERGTDRDLSRDTRVVEALSYTCRPAHPHQGLHEVSFVRIFFTRPGKLFTFFGYQASLYLQATGCLPLSLAHT